MRSIMINPIDKNNIASGVAALSICESLLLAMGDLKIMNETEAVGVINDAAEAHRAASTGGRNAALHLAVVEILDRIVAGGNSIRRP
jgi:hypothetical protein